MDDWGSRAAGGRNFHPYAKTRTHLLEFKIQKLHRPCLRPFAHTNSCSAKSAAATRRWGGEARRAVVKGYAELTLIMHLLEVDRAALIAIPLKWEWAMAERKTHT